ncbi:MAG: TIGR03086 family protein [Actinobacteria bacterium]|nr:TIGR03086 family protein [Actinomycetota bacterium]
MQPIAEQHLRACRGFGLVVGAGAGRWDWPSPCEAWDARAVLEHVIGFHDVLVLRPLGAKPHRPRDDAPARWHLTYGALATVLARSALLERPTDIPAIGDNPPMQLDLSTLLPMLMQDVLVHTWDLAQAVEVDTRLDPDLCAACYERLPADPDTLAASGTFAAAVVVRPDADVQDRLIGRLGRDPSWRSPRSGSRL